jgi:2-hydroxy-6-oxonona-2,4-dienedioate hydrolase
VLRFLDAIDVDKVYITGESLGGWVAAALAEKYPEKVERIVLNTMGGTMANPKVMERLLTLSTEAANDPSWERVKARLEWLMADPAAVTADLIRTRQAIFQQPDWKMACEMNMALQDLETRKRNMISDDDLRAIIVPALVIWTTKDPSGPVDEGRRIASLIPNGRLAVIENAGHWPQYEQTDIFNKIELDFLLEPTLEKGTKQ